MIELKKDEYKRVLPLLTDLNCAYLFANAVVENNQYGHIFVNNETKPSCCLIVNSGGAYLVAGEETDTNFNNILLQFLKDKSNHLNYFDLSTSSEKWLRLIKVLLEGEVVKLSRTAYVFSSDKRQLDNNWQSEIPESFILKRMGEELYDKFLQSINPIYKKTWGSFEEFTLKGFGYCLLDGDKFVSICTSDYIANGYASVDILTMNEYQRQGFATITCSAFIKHCLQNNLIPVWNADSGNELSNKLALKLGFSKVNEYDMLWWHENNEVIKQYLEKYNYE